MPPRSLLRSFLALWIVTGLVLLFAGATTSLNAAHTSQHANPHLVLLGGIEAISAVLFLIPRTLRVGAAGLMAAITIAFVVHAGLGEFRGDLLLYGVTVLFILVHGPLTLPQWRAALSA